MNDTVKPLEPPAVPARGHRSLRRVLLWAGSVTAILIVCIVIAGEILLHRAGPMIKAKVIETLSTRFDSRVDLAEFHVSVVRGFEVSGSGLKLYPNHLAMEDPLLQVDRFSFHALSWRELFASPMYIHKVQVNGLEIHLPPKDQRANMPSLGETQKRGVDESHGRIRIVVGEILINNAYLIIENNKPGKLPVQFIIHKVRLDSVGAGRPMKFEATLINPKPTGNIASSGDFGPFNSESPADTAVRGKYTFSKADLSSIRGIGGMLSSTGTYQGQLNNIIVDGETSTPDFRLTSADHPVPLNTKFHAIVDGTNGDVHLQPVDAWLKQTQIVARGDVVRIAGAPGRDIRLEVTVQPGRMEDLLQLVEKTRPTLMTGQVFLHANFDLPPGPESVTDKLRLKGTFNVLDAHFILSKIQSRLDELSLRGQGHAELAKQESEAMKRGDVRAGTAADVASEMRGNFAFGGEKLSIGQLNFRVPGADIALSGNYLLNGQVLNFTGTARLDAHVSQMVTGWKSWLLRPVDPFFAKDGAGTEVPVKITGTRTQPQFGLDFH